MIESRLTLAAMQVDGGFIRAAAINHNVVTSTPDIYSVQLRAIVKSCAQCIRQIAADGKPYEPLSWRWWVVMLASDPGCQAQTQDYNN